MTDFRWLNESFAVAPQLERSDLARAAEAGFRVVINNRPDGEAPGQPSSGDLRAEASALGLAYLEIPFAGPPPAEAVARTVSAIASADKPILAFCRTGTRSTSVWALASAQMGADADEILAAAARAGYDLSALRPALRQAGGVS